MNEVARLVGMEQRSYEKDGQNRRYCGLHLMYLEDSVEGVRGSKVECLSCPQRVDPNRLKIGSLYALEYSIFNTKGGKMARLTGLDPVDEG